MEGSSLVLGVIHGLDILIALWCHLFTLGVILAGEQIALKEISFILERERARRRKGGGREILV